MYEFFLSIFLGIVEGLTEFLPVSSTAHLRICEALLRIDLHDGFWKMYTIVIQLGAILALPVYFRERILTFLRSFPRGERGDRTILTHPLSLTLIAFIVTAVPAWALTKQIGKNLENLWVMAWALLIGGIIMWIVDVVFRRPRTTHMEEMTLPQAVWIGAAQVLSVILSMPTMFVATGYDFVKTVMPHHHESNIAPLAMNGHQWIVLVIGFVVSFFVALGVVAWFMQWVRSRGFVPFAVYRIVLGIGLLMLLIRGII